MTISRSSSHPLAYTPPPLSTDPLKPLPLPVARPPAPVSPSSDSLQVLKLAAPTQALGEDATDPSFGNFAGALSWPVPLSVKNQREVANVVACNSANLPGLPLQFPRGSALAYLGGAVSLPKTDGQDPAGVVKKLLASPRAQALGEAIRLKVKGIATERSTQDYLLAALHLGLDPESIEQPVRNHVAGFDLMADTFWGRSPAVVVSALGEHLNGQGKTSNATAAVGAHLLLARVAPQFLVRNIPDGVGVGSQAWVNLCLAVARLEVETPGKAAFMNFSDVMQEAQSAPHASEAVQKAALIDWAIANQVLEQQQHAPYSDDQIEIARAAFNQQQSALKAASERLEAPMPNRKAMALALLQKTFGNDIDFEAKSLRITYVPEARANHFSLPYSMLDITMQGLKLDDNWRVLAGSDLDLNAFREFTRSPPFNIPEAFDRAFAEVTQTYKDIKHSLLMNAITHLPLEDRVQLNQGTLRFFKENAYRRSLVPFVGDSLFHSSPTIFVQAEYAGKTRSYAFDTVKGTVRATLPHPADREPAYVSDEVTRFEAFYPDKSCHTLNTSGPTGPRPNHFQNPRIQDIAATVVKGLDIDSDTVKRQAAGRTPTEQHRDSLNAMGDFLLDLIPLRSALVNFYNGNYQDGVTDLAFDVFGFVTAGIGMASKLAKVAGKAGNALTKLTHGSRIIGATALSAFNPLGGLGDLTVGAGKLAIQASDALSSGTQRLRGMASGADLAYASARFDAAATGAFSVGEKAVVGSAVKHQGHWYAFDADSLQPYGPPLADFNPTDTLMPPTRTTHTHTPERITPYATRAPHPHEGAIKEPLPAGDYVENTVGKLVPGHFIPGDGLEQTKALFTHQMENYHNAIKAAGALLPPPPLPVLPRQTSPANLISEALKVSQGLVFGESHSQMASFKLLMANLQTFQAQGVKKVYFEGMIDLPPFGPVDDGISSLGSLKNGRTNPTFTELRDAFKKHGMEVLPLDHYYLTRHKDERPFRARTVQGLNSEVRLKEFNYYAAETILADAGTDKWIALVGNAHMNTSEGVTGLAEMTGSLGIGVFDNKNVPASVGFRDTRHIPDPTQPLKRGDLPGNLHIYVKP